MQTVINFFRDTFLDEMQTTMSGDRIASGLLVAFFLSLFAVLVYRITYQGVVFSKSYCFSLVLAAMVTSVIIMTVTTNLMLSLGMVGALSIVRFRTAVKEPNDTVFMFWSICIGIMAGAGLIYISIITNVALGLLYLLLYLTAKKIKAVPYLLMVRYLPSAKDEVQNAVLSLPKSKIRSKIASADAIELCIEVRLAPKALALVDTLSEMEGVLTAQAISFNGDTTL